MLPQPLLNDDENTAGANRPCRLGRTPGAQPRNTNAIAHGLTSSGWPAGHEHSRRLVAKFTRALRAAVLQAKGEIGLVDAATIQSCARWERHARLAAGWLRREADSLTPDQRLAFSRETARASSERDRCLRQLGLDVRPPDDDWPELPGVALLPHDSQVNT